MRRIFPLFIFIIFGYFLTAGNFNARLGMIDDHEIALFLGPDGRIPAYEIPRVIGTTEVGKWGTYLRYRPSYYTLRVVETALFRDNAVLWYVSRYILFVGSMYLGFLILSSFVPRLVSYFFIFVLFTLPFWPDLMTRLGPSEIYTVPGLLLFAYGLQKNKLLPLSLGYVLCVGSKENFLILFPLLLVWIYSMWKSGRMARRSLITVLLLSVYTFFITGGILLATSRAGTDIYGVDISYRYRVTKFIYDIPRIIRDRRVLPVFILIAASLLLSTREVSRMGIRKFVKSRAGKIVGCIGVILIVIASQYIFYINQLPSSSRYDFPAVPLIPVLALAASLLIIEVTQKSKYARTIGLGVYIAVLIASCALIVRRGYDHIQIQSRRNAEITRTFDASLNRAVSALSDNPEATVVFVSTRFIDFEPIVSVSRYLSAKQVSNRFMLHFTPDPLLTDPLGRQLQDRIAAASQGKPDPEKLFDRFSPYEDGGERMCVYFGAAELTGCREIARF